MSEMSGFGNKNVHFLHLSGTYLHTKVVVGLKTQPTSLICRVDFSQPEYVGRLKSTLPADSGLYDAKNFLRDLFNAKGRCE